MSKAIKFVAILLFATYIVISLATLVAVTGRAIDVRQQVWEKQP